jgi:hypothetical protein
MVDVVDLASSLQGRLHQASQFAKFLVAPYCLDLVPYNFFCQIMGETIAEEKVFLVAMEDHVFPLLLHVSPVRFSFSFFFFFFLVFFLSLGGLTKIKRTLPLELLNFYKHFPFDLAASGLTFSNAELFGVDVSSGVDETIIRRNLFALSNILHILSSKQYVHTRHGFADDFWFLAHIVP